MSNNESSDHSNPRSETGTSNHAEQASHCHRGGCCKPHTSLYISVAALALAGYAAFNVSSGHTSAVETQMNQLDSKLSGINLQLEALSQEVQSNRDNLVQNKLKKALENIRDISGIAEAGSKEAISKVETMLQDLTTLGEKLIAPAATEPAVAEQPTPEATNTAPATPAVKPTAPESTVPELPIITDDNAATTQAVPAQTAPAAEDNATSSMPATAASKTIEPAIKTTPEVVPSAPQAF